MNKKIIIYSLIVLMSLIFVGCAINDGPPESPPTIESRYIMEFDEYKDLKLEDVDYVEKIRYTEAGDNHETINSQLDIESLYNSLSKIKVIEESAGACEDNTTIYNFYTKDGKKYSFEFECEWIIIGNTHYTHD